MLVGWIETTISPNKRPNCMSKAMLKLNDLPMMLNRKGLPCLGRSLRKRAIFLSLQPNHQPRLKPIGQQFVGRIHAQFVVQLPG